MFKVNNKNTRTTFNKLMLTGEHISSFNRLQDCVEIKSWEFFFFFFLTTCSHISKYHKIFRDARKIILEKVNLVFTLTTQYVVTSFKKIYYYVK